MMLYEDEVDFFPQPYTHRDEIPPSVEEAQRWMADLGSRIQWIDGQLGDPLRKESLPNGEYRDWRRRAVAAKNHLSDERRRLQLWLSEHRAELKRQRHEVYVAASKDRAQKLKMERGKYPVLSDAFDSVRLLHEVFIAASLLVDDDGDENWEGLEQAVNFARGWRVEDEPDG
jgi:hypothetical protein